MTGGKHIFGNFVKIRILNIKENKPSFNILINKPPQIKGDQKFARSDKWLSFTSRDLMRALIDKEPNERPSCNLALTHPCLWTIEKTFHFFHAIISELKDISWKTLDATNLETEYNGKSIVINNNWIDFMRKEKKMSNELKEEQNLKGDLARDLLLFMGKHVGVTCSITLISILCDYIPVSFLRGSFYQ